MYPKIKNKSKKTLASAFHDAVHKFHLQNSCWQKINKKVIATTTTKLLIKFIIVSNKSCDWRPIQSVFFSLSNDSALFPTFLHQFDIYLMNDPEHLILIILEIIRCLILAKQACIWHWIRRCELLEYFFLIILHDLVKCTSVGTVSSGIQNS